MLRWLLRWIASLLIVAACALPAPAQDQSNKQGDSDESTGSTAALPAVMAVLSTLLVLVIVCKPSRKS